MSDFKFSNYFVKERTGKAIGFMLICYVIFALIFNTFTIMNSNEFFDQFEIDSDYVLNQIPEYNIEEGEVAFVDGTTYKEIVTENVIVYIDLDGKNSDSYYEEIEKTNIVITKEKIMYMNVDLAYFKDWNNAFMKEDLEVLPEYVKPMFYMVLVFVSLLGIAGVFIISAFILGLVIIINGLIKTNLTTGECYRVAIYSMVVPGIFTLVHWMLPFAIPMAYVIYIAIAGYYAYQFLVNYEDEPFDLETVYE